MQGNYIDSGKDDGTALTGIMLAGAGSTGAAVELATGIITGNTVRRHGEQSATSGGGIMVYLTANAVVSGNTIYRPGYSGVNVWHTNSALTVQGNIVEDAWTDTQASAAMLALRSSHNTLSVGGNALRRGSKAATVVNLRGIQILSTTSNTGVDLGNDWSGASSSIPVAGGSAVFATVHQSHRLAFFGAAPVAKPASPGTATGTDAAVINNLVSSLRSLGLIT